MKVVIPGGTGQVGGILRRALAASGHEVTVLSRRAAGAGEVRWDGETPGSWVEALDGNDVVINLAGRSVGCRYSDANLREMMDSRVRSARVVGRAGMSRWPITAVRDRPPKSPPGSNRPADR